MTEPVKPKGTETIADLLNVSAEEEKRALAFHYRKQTGLHPDDIAPVPKPKHVGNVVAFPRKTKGVPRE